MSEKVKSCSYRVLVLENCVVQNLMCGMSEKQTYRVLVLENAWCGSWKATSVSIATFMNWSSQSQIQINACQNQTGQYS